MTRTTLGAWAGVFAGLGLAAELALFTLSGWSPQAFGAIETAIAVMQEGGGHLRMAGAVGVLNLALFTLFLVGLADHFNRTTPALGAAVLHLGLVGVATHAIVPIALYVGIPYFLRLAGDPSAGGAWHAFRILMDTARGAGGIFMGLSMLAVGAAALSHRLLPVGLGVLALLGGALVFATPLSVGTPLVRFVPAIAMLGIVVSILFRIWGGLALRSAAAAAEARGD